MTIPFLAKLEASHPFTEREAWGLFRLAALGEACGWTLLISGILISRSHLPGHTIAVPIAGQLHGMLFLAYFGVLIATYSSLRWPRLQFLAAAAAGVLPFGTLIFEQWAVRTRRQQHYQALFYSTILARATKEPSLSSE